MKATTKLIGSSLSIVFLCVASSPSAAQGPVHETVPAPASGIATMGTGNPSVEVKRDVTGQIAQINSTNNTVVVKDEKTGKRLAFHLDKHTKLKADKQTELAGRKNLSLADFKSGHFVKLTYRARDGKPLELRLRANKS
jgi:hypothetical protein